MTKEKRLAYYVGCLLPLVSVLLYRGLPDDLPMQFNSQGDVNYTFPKWGALVLLNVIGPYLNWLYFYRTKKNPELTISNHFFFCVRLAFFPLVTSLILVFIWLSNIKGVTVNISEIVTAIVASAFLIIGNFLPKFKHKKMFYFPFIGNQAADNRVWRMLGIGMVVSGVTLFINLYFHSRWLLVVPLILCVVVPIILTLYYRSSSKSL
ncbi:DUF1648 domain-containing protein [Vagococcus sp. BWB3-3]|uniref:DUF1648 domain-containing protein n=1 Tax=Vagococcus allomyrinae TaxID=2794353 RepID=A0A940PB61_9ENTE|nr:DUF1648 domain-containing protein [Vagococcus allomyrinae]MBP1041754.1 DUF1648 domain-containing protein [Vagococcus allomyrinae]